MRTAEEIIKETFPNVVYRFDGLMQADVNANDIRKAMKLYAKEAIEECADLVDPKTQSRLYNSILNLKNELE